MQWKYRVGLLLVVVGAAGCGDDASETDGSSSGTGASGTGGEGTGGEGTGASSTGASSTGGSGMGGGATGGGTTGGAGGSGGAAALQPTVVTFNSGTTSGNTHDAGPGDVYTSDDEDTSDQYYGNGLSWLPAVEATRVFFETLQPDIVVFQEIFHAEECVNIPAQYHTGFFCETWSPGDPTVAQHVLGPGYQVACHLGKPDKCAAVRTAFGSFQGCNDDFCLEGLAGGQVNGCGGGSRIGRGVIDLAGGGTMTVVNVHGTSGILFDDQDCRVQQIEQVFEDLLDGSGQPAANGARNVVMGDLNTDPARNTLFDISAQRWNDFVGGGNSFQWISEVGNNATPTYAGLLNIDHVASDTWSGSCWSAGVTPGHPDIYPPAYFDHKPLVCELQLP